MHEFRIGDTVYLITSPNDVMQVSSVFGQRLIECSWVGKEGKLHKHSFRPESLHLVSAEDPTEYHHQDHFLRISKDED